jgi:hypothetical protein
LLHALSTSGTGGRCFGYRSIKSDDGSARLEVNEAEAEIIRRIFRLYAESVVLIAMAGPEPARKFYLYKYSPRQTRRVGRSLLRGLAESVLRTEAIDYVVAKLEDALREQFQNLDAELRALKLRKQQIESEIGRLVQATAGGQSSKSLMAAITTREGELKGITDRLLEPGPGSLTETLGHLRAIAMERLANLRTRVAHPENVEQTRAALAEYFGTFKMEASQ